MRQVIAYELVSLDGVAEDPDKFITTWDEEMDANLARVITSQDAVILGRRSYDEWSAFWPTATIEPFATFINGVEKHVATSSPLAGSWNNTTVVDGDLMSFVRQLKGTTGGDIGVHASISVTQALLAAGLIDEIRLVVAPVIAAGGRRLFDNVPEARLECVRSVASSSGHQLLDYRVLPSSAA